MSYRLQDLFWTIDLPGTEQLVAQRLAWHAKDDDARCWPGLASLSKSTGLSPRAIQNAIKALDQAGHITRDQRPGIGTVYTIHPRTSCAGGVSADDDLASGGNPKATPPARCAPPPAAVDAGGASAADAQPPHEVHPRTSCTPAPDASDPRTSCVQTGQEQGRHDDGSAGADARVERITGKRGRRIDHDWQPTLPLPEPVAKVVAGWPPGRLEEEVAEFRDFWLADAGDRASKRDWDRTWWNRLRSLIRRSREREAQHATRRGGGGQGRRQGYRDAYLERELAAGGRDPGLG